MLAVGTPEAFEAAGAAGLAVCVAAALGLRPKVGFVALADLVVVPQHDHGKAKNHPQNGAADIVHEDVFTLGDMLVNLENREKWVGTVSMPPSHHGWQRPKRFKVR